MADLPQVELMLPGPAVNTQINQTDVKGTDFTRLCYKPQGAATDENNRENDLAPRTISS